MKLIIGFIAGCFVGGYWVSNSTERQRQQAREAAVNAGRRLKESRVGKAVDDNASKLASTTGNRVVEAVDTTGETLVDTISGGDRQAAV